MEKDDFIKRTIILEPNSITTINKTYLRQDIGFTRDQTHVSLCQVVSVRFIDQGEDNKDLVTLISLR